ncbi:MAG: hypothetical protein MZU97_25025 [Bacillus subtilis]|nr:hypothetical protein [Bacillus subtilis]
MVVAVIVFVFSVYFILTGDPMRAILVIAVLLAYFGLTFLFQWMNLQSVIKKSPLVHNPVDQVYQFKEDAIFMDGKTRIVLPYDEIHKVVVYGPFMVITDKFKKPYIIDTSKFESVQDKETVRKHLIVKIGKNISE